MHVMERFCLLKDLYFYTPSLKITFYVKVMTKQLISILSKEKGGVPIATNETSPFIGLAQSEQRLHVDCYRPCKTR